MTIREYIDTIADKLNDCEWADEAVFISNQLYDMEMALRAARNKPTVTVPDLDGVIDDILEDAEAYASEMSLKAHRIAETLRSESL